MQQLPTKPKSIKGLPLEIERFKSHETILVEFQEEYKRKVGLSGHTRNSLPFHPKALETELADLKTHFSNLESNYIELLTQEKFLQYILQEPPLSIVETQSTRRELDEAEAKYKKYGLQVQKLGQQIMFIAKSIEAAKETFDHSTEEITNMLDYIAVLEEELARIDNLLASSKSELTIDEAKTILNQQTVEMTRLTQTISEREDSIADQEWRVEDLEEEVGRLDTKAKDLQRKAKQAVITNQQRDARIEKEYLDYKRHTDLCNHMFGIENIEFESTTAIHITYAEPIQATLHIQLDTTSGKILDTSSITGTVVPIQDLIRMANQTNVNDGIKLISLEILARLKRKH